MSATEIIDAEAEWRALRAQVIGGSEVAALFDAHPFMTRFELWHQKNGTLPPVDLSDDERVQAGQFLEPAIAAWIVDRKQWQVRKVRRHLRHPDDTIALGGSLDYEIVGHERGAGVLEIKTVDRLIFRNWEDGEPPLHHELQLQAYLAITGREWGAIAALIGGNDLRIFERERRPKTIAMIERAVADFWLSIVEGREPKPNFDTDGDAIARIYAEAKAEKTIDLSGDNRLPLLCSEYQQASALEKEGTKRKDAAKAEILTKLGDAARAICGDYVIAAATVAGSHVEYDRKPYRNFRLTERKEKSP